MVELEKQGIPTVVLTAQAFVKDARQSAKTFGLKNLPLAVVPLPFSNQPGDSIRKMVDDSFDQIIAGLTQAVGESNPLSTALPSRSSLAGQCQSSVRKLGSGAIGWPFTLRLPIGLVAQP